MVVPDFASAAPTTRYVATNGSDSENDCTTQSAPCKTIPYAVDEAASGDTVSLAAGTYSDSVTIRKRLDVVGPPTGVAAITAGTTGFGLAVAGADAAVTVSRITVSGIDGAGLTTFDRGTLTVEDSMVQGNGTFGILSDAGGHVTVLRSVVRDNPAGGVIGFGATVDVVDSVVSDNGNAEQDANAIGSGVAAVDGNVTVTGSTVGGNGGGGILAVSANISVTPMELVTAVVSRSTVVGNAQLGIGVSGSGGLTVDTSTVAATTGVGIYSQASPVVVRNSSVVGTLPTDFGGAEGAPTQSSGLYFESTVPTELPAARHTALGRRTLTARLGTRTLTARPAVRYAEAADDEAGISVAGSLLDQSAGVHDCTGGLTADGGYNFSSDTANSCGFTAAKHDLAKTDPKLGALADNGGPTATRLPAADSAALDSIPSGEAGCVAGATDQRGIARPQGARCDIGAVERELDNTPVPPLRIMTESLPHGQVGESYRKTLQATGGTDDDYVWSLAPGSSLPSGLELSAAGLITGTPTKAGTYSVTVSLNDPVTRRYSLVIDAAEAAPAGNNDDPIAATGAPSASLTAWGAGLVLLGLVVLLAAGVVGRRPGRHRPPSQPVLGPRPSWSLAVSALLRTRLRAVGSIEPPPQLDRR